MKIFDKRIDPYSTPIITPIITIDFIKDTGVIIAGNRHYEYYGSIGFYSQQEYDNFKGQIVFTPGKLPELIN